MTAYRIRRDYLRQAVLSTLLGLLGGCSALLSTSVPPPALYSLDSPAQSSEWSQPRAPTGGRTLLVNQTRAVAGFDSPHMVYLRHAHKPEYFAQNQWIDTPARMLTPLIITAIEHGASFRTVVHAPSTALNDVRLDTEIIRLEHEFLQRPSQIHFTLRATLIDSASGHVLATREFDALATAPSEDPYGGVLAAQIAVADVLQSLAGFCATVAAPTAHGQIKSPLR